MRLRGLPWWFDRVDAFVHHDMLSMLVYKKVAQLQGYPDGSKWFDDDFRFMVNQRTNNRSDTPAESQASEK